MPRRPHTRQRRIAEVTVRTLSREEDCVSHHRRKHDDYPGCRTQNRALRERRQCRRGAGAGRRRG
eukprot:6046778-Pleurochrysis_carterae.AAC.1